MVSKDTKEWLRQLQETWLDVIINNNDVAKAVKGIFEGKLPELNRTASFAIQETLQKLFGKRVHYIKTHTEPFFFGINTGDREKASKISDLLNKDLGEGKEIASVSSYNGRTVDVIERTMDMEKVLEALDIIFDKREQIQEIMNSGKAQSAGKGR